MAGMFLNIKANFIIFFHNKLIIKLTGLFFYMEDDEISIYRIKKAVFAQVIMNFFSHWQ